MAARALEEKILEIGPERVVVFIGEPIQGAAVAVIRRRPTGRRCRRSSIGTASCWWSTK